MLSGWDGVYFDDAEGRAIVATINHELEEEKIMVNSCSWSLSFSSTYVMRFFFILALSSLKVNTVWLMALVRYSYCKALSCLPSLFFKNSTTIERIDPVVSKNKVVNSAHFDTGVLFYFILFYSNNDHRNITCNFWKQIQHDSGYNISSNMRN